MAYLINATRAGENMFMRHVLLIVASAVLVGSAQSGAYAEEIYAGYVGEWIEVAATAYTPADPIDGRYHATKGRWRWKTADGRTDVRNEPYGVAVPLKRGTKTPYWPFGTKLIVPAESGYVTKARADDRMFIVDDVGAGRQYFRYDRAGRIHLDFRFVTRYSAINWVPHGSRVVRVFKVSSPAPAVEPQPEPTIEIPPDVMVVDSQSSQTDVHRGFAVIGLAGFAFALTVLLAAWKRSRTLA